MAKLADGTPLNKAVYNAYRNAGLTHNQALAVTAEVGRENGFQANILFGKHTDLAKDKNGGSIVNAGMLSWNGSRGKKLLSYLGNKGQLGSKGMPHTQANLNAQAAFSVQEMKKPYYAKKMPNFWKTPNAAPETFAKEVGSKYVGWAYGQNTVKQGSGKARVAFDWKKHDDRRRGYLNDLSAITGGAESSNLQSVPILQAEPTPIQIVSNEQPKTIEPKTPDYTVINEDLYRTDNTKADSSISIPTKTQAEPQIEDPFNDSALYGTATTDIAKPSILDSKVTIQKQDWNQIADRVFGTQTDKQASTFDFNKPITRAIGGVIKGIV